MGLSPYDKKSYRKSKRRRQTFRLSKTGYFEPYRRGKKRRVILICAAGMLCAVIAALLIINPFASPPESSESTGRQLSREERLRPVNKANPLNKSDVPPLVDFENVKVHAAIAGELEAMCSAARQQGIKLSVVKGYVSFDEQQKLYEDNLAEYMKIGSYTPVRAQAAAQRVVPEAGCCEAQTGLYVEFDFSDKRAKAFTERECIRYGFIQRFAENKEDITHMQCSQTAYRYVGKEDAEKMRAFDMCLEEYADYADSQLSVTL